VRDELRQIEEQKKNLKLNLDRTEKESNHSSCCRKNRVLYAGETRSAAPAHARPVQPNGSVEKLEGREEELEEILASSFKGK